MATNPPSPTTDLTTPGGGFVSTDPTVQARLAEMNKQVLASATPQARFSEEVRQMGAATAEEAERIKTPGNSAYDEVAKYLSTATNGSTISSDVWTNRVQDAQQQVQSRVNRPLASTSAGQGTNVNEQVAGAEEFDKKSVEEDPLFKLIGQRREQLKEENRYLVESLQRNYDDRIRGTQESQRAETGMNMMALARGGALGTSGSGIAFMNKMANEHRSEINTLETQRNDALRQAAFAASKEDFELLGVMIARADKLEEDFHKAQQRRIDNLLKYKQIENIEKEELSGTLSALASAGKTLADLPDGYLEFQERAAGLSPGTGRFLFEANKKEADLKVEQADMARRKDEASLERETYSIAKSIIDIRESVPRGQSIKIGDAIYHGIGTGHLKTGIEEDSKTGENIYYEFDPLTQEMRTYPTGIYKKEDGWELIWDGAGQPFRYNTNTNQMEYAGAPTGWHDIIPEGSKGGQCGKFFNTLTGYALPVGNEIETKLKYADPNLTPDKLRVGDGFITDESGGTGHIGFINQIVDVNGRKQLILTESNLRNDERVTHTRKMWADDPRLKGFIPSHGKLDKALLTGSDAPKFQPKTTTSDKALSIAEIEKANASLPPEKRLKLGATMQDAADAGYIPTAGGTPGSINLDPRIVKMSDSVRNDFTDMITLESQIAKIKALKEKQDTGPLTTGLSKLGGVFGKGDNEVIEMTGLTEDMRSLIMKERSGSAVSEAEFKRLAEFLPSSWEQDQSFNIKLKQLEDKYAGIINERAKFYGFASGDEFKRALNQNQSTEASAQNQSSGGTARIKGPNGTVLEYNLSDTEQAKEYQEALKNGWVKL